MAKPRPCIVPCCQGEKFELVHKFPADRERAELWKRILGISELASLDVDTIRARYFICSRHFRDSDYKNKLSRSLNVTANPSLNLTELCDAEGLNRVIPPIGRPCQLNDSSSVEKRETNLVMVSLEVQPFMSEELNAKSTMLCDYDPLANAPPDVGAHYAEGEKKQRQVEFVNAVPKAVAFAGQKRVLGTGTMAGNTPAKTFRFSKDLKLVKLEGMTEAKGSPTDSLVLRKVKLTSPLKNMQKERTLARPKVEIASAETQTDFEQQNETEVAIPEKIEDKDSQQDQEKAETTTKVLALLECTPENLEKLKQKMTGGAVVFDEKLFQETSEEQDEQAMSAMKQSTIDERQFLTLRRSESDDPIRVSYVWLRDHCRCSQCYNHETFQRSFSILDAPDDIRPTSYAIRDGALNILWNDDHASSYDVEFIFGSQFQVYKESLLLEQSQPVLWDSALIGQSSDYCRVTLNELLCDDEVVQRFVKSLITYGVGFIEKVPTNPQSTEMAVRRMFPIHRTLFGEMWTFSDSMDHSDTAYTKDYLGPHTDNFYFSDASGLQILHCIQLNATGGETILIDGFKAVEQLRLKKPEVFERLCNYPVTGEYLEEGKHHTYCAPIIKRNIITGEIEQLRFNIYDQAILKTIPQEQMPQFYADIKDLGAEINAEGMAWKFQLKPGTVLIFDNWRVLHGRLAYSGKRVMSGCYVSRTEYRSLARTLGIIS